MANITIDTTWTDHTNPPAGVYDKLVRRFRVLARARRIAGRRRSVERLVRRECTDPRLLKDLGVAPRRSRTLEYWLSRFMQFRP